MLINLKRSLLILLFLVFNCAFSQTWEDFALPLPDTDEIKDFVVVSDTEVYVLNDNKLVKWDGTAWASLGDLSAFEILSFAYVSENEIYAITFLSGDEFSFKVKKWNGTTWDDFYFNPNVPVWMGNIKALSATDVYFFTSYYTESVFHRWNGSGFTSVSSGRSPGNYWPIDPTFMIRENPFGMAGDGPRKIFAYNRVTESTYNNWAGHQLGPFDNINSLSSKGRNLIYFSNAISNSSTEIYKWDNANLQLLPNINGNGLVINNNYVDVNFVYVHNDDELYASGDLQLANAQGNNIVVKWDGTEWSDFGSINSQGQIMIVFNGNYLYAISTYIEAGNTYKSIKRIDIGAPEPLSIDEVLGFDDLKIFPNPVLDVVNLSKSIKKISLISISGNLIKTEYDTSEINVSKLATGIYILKLEDENGSISIKKFVKQ